MSETTLIVKSLENRIASLTKCRKTIKQEIKQLKQELYAIIIQEKIKDDSPETPSRVPIGEFSMRTIYTCKYYHIDAFNTYEFTLAQLNNLWHLWRKGIHNQFPLSCNVDDVPRLVEDLRRRLVNTACYKCQEMTHTKDTCPKNEVNKVESTEITRIQATEILMAKLENSGIVTITFFKSHDSTADQLFNLWRSWRNYMYQLPSNLSDSQYIDMMRKKLIDTACKKCLNMTHAYNCPETMDEEPEAVEKSTKEKIDLSGDLLAELSTFDYVSIKHFNEFDFAPEQLLWLWGTWRKNIPVEPMEFTEDWKNYMRNEFIRTACKECGNVTHAKDNCSETKKEKSKVEKVPVSRPMMYQITAFDKLNIDDFNEFDFTLEQLNHLWNVWRKDMSVPDDSPGNGDKNAKYHMKRAFIITACEDCKTVTHAKDNCPPKLRMPVDLGIMASARETSYFYIKSFQNCEFTPEQLEELWGIWRKSSRTLHHEDLAQELVETACVQCNNMVHTSDNCPKLYVKTSDVVMDGQRTTVYSNIHSNLTDKHLSKKKADDIVIGGTRTNVYYSIEEFQKYEFTIERLEDLWSMWRQKLIPPRDRNKLEEKLVETACKTCDNMCHTNDDCPKDNKRTMTDSDFAQLKAIKPITSVGFNGFYLSSTQLLHLWGIWRKNIALPDVKFLNIETCCPEDMRKVLITTACSDCEDVTHTNDNCPKKKEQIGIFNDLMRHMREVNTSKYVMLDISIRAFQMQKFTNDQLKDLWSIWRTQNILPSRGNNLADILVKTACKECDNMTHTNDSCPKKEEKTFNDLAKYLNKQRHHTFPQPKPLLDIDTFLTYTFTLDEMKYLWRSWRPGMKPNHAYDDHDDHDHDHDDTFWIEFYQTKLIETTCKSCNDVTHYHHPYRE